MAADLSNELRQTIERERANLRGLTDQQASIPRGPGKWCPKEELGHLIDSASNNHIRFVRGSIEPEMRGPGYAQDEWVRLHGYIEMPWARVVDFWFEYNSFLSGLIGNIPEDRLQTQCFVGASAPMTLRFLIADYILHMQHHIDQLLRREVITAYPSTQVEAARKA